MRRDIPAQRNPAVACECIGYVLNEFIGDEGATDIYNALLSSPYCSLSLYISVNNISRLLKDKIKGIVKNNAALKGKVVNHPPANLSTDEHIRCYNLPLTDLQTEFMTITIKGNWSKVTSIFIYGTDFTESFTSTWLSIESNNQHLQSVKTMTLM